MPLKDLHYFMINPGWFNFLVLMSILMLKSYKLGRNFGLAVILGFLGQLGTAVVLAWHGTKAQFID